MLYVIFIIIHLCNTIYKYSCQLVICIICNIYINTSTFKLDNSTHADI